MKKIDVKFYQLEIRTSEGGAAGVCVAYNLDTAKEFVGLEFYEIVRSLPNPGLSIPSSRQATFQEELRILKTAAATFKGARNLVVNHIEQLLNEAYGSDANVRVEEIDPQANPLF